MLFRSILFIGFLITPVTVKVFGWNNSINIENRIVYKFPKFNIYKLEDFINEYDTYYKENFGLRYLLFAWYSNFKIAVLNESPLPDRALVGKKGWLFLGDLFGFGLKEQAGIIQFNTKELKSFADSIVAKQKYFDSLNIKYYLCVAPNKQTIYPEILPYSIVPNKSKLDLLSVEMKKYPQLNFIDVLSPLNNKKDSVDLYYKSDSHWNRLGAFIAYNKIMSELAIDFPEIKPVTYEHYTIKPFSGIMAKDIANMINQKYFEADYEFILKENVSLICDSNVFSPNDKKITYEVRYRNPTKKLKVLVFGDSFAASMVDFLIGNFGSTIFIGPTMLKKEIIENEKPDIVIQEVVERDIDFLIY